MFCDMGPRTNVCETRHACAYNARTYVSVRFDLRVSALVNHERPHTRTKCRSNSSSSSGDGRTHDKMLAATECRVSLTRPNRVREETAVRSCVFVCVRCTYPSAKARLRDRKMEKDRLRTQFKCREHA